MDIIFISFIFSIIGSIMFWKKKLGISVMIFAAGLIYATIYILKNNKRIENKKAFFMIIPIMLLASTYFLFDNKFLEISNLVIIPIIYMVMIISLIGKRIDNDTRFIKKIAVMYLEPIGDIGDSLNYLSEKVRERLNIKSKKDKKEKDEKDVNYLASFLKCIPIVMAILLLLVTADNEFFKLFFDIFEGFFEWLFDLELPELSIRVFLIILSAIYLISFFRNILSKYNILEVEEKVKNKKEKDLMTYNMLFTTLNVLYIVFCFIQIKNMITVRSYSSDSSYSYFARKGFFQLILVSFINLIMILKSTSKDVKINTGRKYIKVMSIIMIVCTLIILMSAFFRMNLYQEKYGYTLLRILVYYGLITEGLMLIPTTIYIFNNKLNLFKIYFIIITTTYCILNFINIDSMIAKKNIDRYYSTGKIDIYYMNELGADSVEQMLRLIDDPKFGEDTETVYKAKYVRECLKDIYAESVEDEQSMFSFNISRNKAKRQLFLKQLVPIEYIK